MVQTEFQAVVFAAGKGSRITELTSGTPKCLLPVGPKPLIWFPLQMLEHAGFTDAILIVSEAEKTEIQTSLDKIDLNIKLDYFSIQSAEDFGTADSLRLLGDKLKSDVVCVSCDLVSDIDLCDALNVFRKHNASLVSVFFQPGTGNEMVVVPGPKAKHKPERDLIGIDAQTNRLVFQASASDFEENLSLPKSLLRKHSHIKLHTQLTEGHLYIMKHWICSYLQHDKMFTTLKGELIPHIVRKQFKKHHKRNKDEKQTNVSIIINNDMRSDDIYVFAKEDHLDLTIREMSAYNDHTGDLDKSYHGDTIRCFAHVTTTKTIGYRINTLLSYWQLNNKIFELWPQITHNHKELVTKDPRSEIQSNQIDDKCIVWESAKLSERTSFKNSILGTNCTVHSKTRVFNSIIMNNVVIKERCAIENCIVCAGAILESGTNIKDCLVGAAHVVPENSQHAKEVLTDSDKLMEF